jgi:hypothetical protein
MRLLIGVAGAVLLVSSAHAGTISAGPDPSRPFSFNFGSGAHVFGPVIFDSYRSLDGKNFYLDESSGSSGRRLHFSALSPGSNQSSATMFSKPFSADFARNGGGFANSGGGGGSGGGSGSAGGFSSQSGSAANSGGSSQSGMKSSIFSQAVLSGIDRDSLPPIGGSNPDPSGASATPLPPAWTMLLIGLGCIGMAASRRRQSRDAHAGI